jgi:hypothetical protein
MTAVLKLNGAANLIAKAFIRYRFLPVQGDWLSFQRLKS